MKLIKQPNKWTCLPTSFAMVLDIPLDIIMTKIGHNGPDFHIQELIDVAMKFNFMVTPIESNPRIGLSEDDCKHVYDFDMASHRLAKYLNEHKGVLTGVFSKKRHAVAYKDKTIYDPNGAEYPIAL